MRVALIGQPNCGKSTLFNSVAGYRSATGNFPGTTVQLAWSRVRLNGSQVELVDVPGIYSLTAFSPTECVARQFLLEANLDLVINVVDASLLERSLNLTLELHDLGLPMVVCLNMSDEALRQGVRVNKEKLAEVLQVPVVETVASRGEGVAELFASVKNLVRNGRPEAGRIALQPDVEEVVEHLACHLCRDDCPFALSRRFLAVKLLEGDEGLLPLARAQVCNAAERLREDLARTRGIPPETLIHAAQRARSRQVFQQVAAVGQAHAGFRERLDALLTHPFWGYVVLLGVLAGFFWSVFHAGAAVETTVLGAFQGMFSRISAGLAQGTLAFALLKSVWDGLAGGAGILLPYLVPFLVGLALLEDTGYLPRVAYLLDGLLHRVGLHGTSMVPLLLGYGCSVPACMATRVLPSQRDRFLATVLATLVPCSARSTVIFALVGFYLGPAWALGVFLLNGAVVFASGLLLTRLWPEVSAGMVLHVPRYQWPSLRVIARKVWLRLREFVVISWPLLIGGSLLLGVAEHLGWTRHLNTALSPLMSLLGLPAVVGTTLVFGVLRKELSLLMLVQALGTTEISAVLSPAQIVVFALFVTFYVPCLATIAAAVKEIGRKLTALVVAYTFLLATVLGAATRWLLAGLGF